MPQDDAGLLLEALVGFREPEAMRVVGEMLSAGADPQRIIDTCREAMAEVGRRFEAGEAFIPELMRAGDMMRAVSARVKPRMAAAAISREPLAPVIIGTVRGDVHDIGKDLVATMLDIAGFEVIDLGVDVPPQRFVDEARARDGVIVALSCLLTVAFASMRQTVEAIDAAGLRPAVRVMIGGAPVNALVGEYAGADGWGADAVAAVNLALQWAGPPAIQRQGPDTAAGSAPAASVAGTDIAVTEAVDLSSTVRAEVGDSPITAVQRRDQRFERWAAAEGVAFDAPEIAAAYRERIQLVRDALELKVPSRVPVVPMWGLYPARWGGLTVHDAMYDYSRLASVWPLFHKEFGLDFQADPIPPGAVFEAIDCRFLQWPGHGVGPDSPYQYIEAEYMKSDDYDDLIRDPSAFWMRSLLPRFAEAYAPWAGLDPFTDINELWTLPYALLPFAHPAMEESFRRLQAGARATMDYMQAVADMNACTSASLGLPVSWMGMVKAPYDVLADTLRGMRGIVGDRFNQPGKILAAVERITPLVIESGIRQMNAGDCPIIFIPLHKGADGFMSDADFREFYWPSLKAVLAGLVEAGIVPALFAEGGYETRLSIIADDGLPDGSLMWFFDATDMAAAKSALGGHACIAGNVPGSLLALGAPADVRACVRGLMDSVAGDGGFILSTATVIDEAQAENVAAMMAAARS